MDLEEIVVIISNKTGIRTIKNILFVIYYRSTLFSKKTGLTDPFTVH